jgi:hypothetical protein
MCKPEESSAKSLSPAAGSGIAAVRRAKLEDIDKAQRENTQDQSDDSQLRAKARDALEAILLSGSVSCLDGSRESPSAKRRSSSTSASEDRARMECHVCGYRCVPQWLNDEAHCLKCQAVLKRRPSVHQRCGTSGTHGSSSLRPVTPPTRQRSKSLSSIYDKSTWGSFAQECRENSTNSSGTYHSTLLSSLASNQEKVSVKESPAGDRSRMECHICGYKCVPQWLNDEAHCLKCQAVLRTRPSIHQRSGASPARLTQRRASTPARIGDKMSSRQLVGPERFFYDRSTYTGSHAHGGPR